MALNEVGNVWMAELLFAIDVETMCIIDASGDVESGLGIHPRETIGRPLFSTLDLDDLHGARAALEEALVTGRATWEGTLNTRSGEVIDYAWEGHLGEAGKVIYVRGREGSRVRAALADIRIFERLADLTTDLFIVVDEAGRIVRANRSALNAFACPEEDLLGERLTGFVPESGRAALDRFMERMATGEKLVNYEIPTVNGEGHDIVMEGTATFDEVTRRWYVVARNVTDRVARQHELEVTQRFFELSKSQLVLVGADNRILRANPAFEAAVGRTRAELVGVSIDDALGAAEPAGLLELLEHVRTEHGSGLHEVEVDRGSAGTLDVHFASAAEAGSVYLSCRDVTEERSLQEELVARASSDGLTGLANRATMEDAIVRELDSGAVTAVLMLDLDGFKQVNDSLGHAAGDELLMRVAERLEQQTRGVDIVSRYGGDEFAILLRGVPDAPTALLVAEKLRKAFHVPFEVQERFVEVTASVGAAVGLGTTHDARQLVSEADLAAYAAKEGGADKSCAFDEALQSASDFAAALEDHLRRVLRSPTFDLEVIPVAGLDGVTCGVGVTAPAIAISGQRKWNAQSMRVAKRLGLLGPLSQRLATETIAGLAPWLRTHPGAYLDIVFDVHEIATAGFTDHVLGLLRAHRIAPSQLLVSIVGVAGIGINAVDVEVFRELRAAGTRVSFAASRADTDTLAALHLGCIDRIDVDSTFLALAPEGSVEHLIASTVFDVADRLGVEVVADASFTPDVIDTVSVFRTCSPVGLVFGAPVPLDEFIGAELPTALPSANDLT